MHPLTASETLRRQAAPAPPRRNGSSTARPAVQVDDASRSRGRRPPLDPAGAAVRYRGALLYERLRERGKRLRTFSTDGLCGEVSPAGWPAGPPHSVRWAHSRAAATRGSGDQMEEARPARCHSARVLWARLCQAAFQFASGDICVVSASRCLSLVERANHRCARLPEGRSCDPIGLDTSDELDVRGVEPVPDNF